MPPAGGDDDFSSDDYVARVLAKEARENSLKYSTQGLEAYMPKRPTSGAPKPNTRFLRHIIRDTDNHNASLKRKEEREARERMRQLGGNSSTSTPSRDQKKHRRHDDLGGNRERRERRRERHRSHRTGHRGRSVSTERDRSRRHRRRRDSHESDEDRRRRHSTRDRRGDGSYSRSHSQSPPSERHENRARRDRHRLSPYHSISPNRSRSRSPKPGRGHKRIEGSDRNGHHSSRQHHSSRKATRRKETPPSADAGAEQPSGHESDPLEDLVGPLPHKEDGGCSADEPVRSRGRGAYKSNLNNIDAHFAADYDPSLDVSLEDNDTHARSTRRPVPGLMTDDDDWELALEALRDRARWRQKGEVRLREAGFNDSVVERWKNNAAFTVGDQTEGSVEDVKWSKKGEGREWDRGKYVNDEGSIDVRASW